MGKQRLNYRNSKNAKILRGHEDGTHIFIVRVFPDSMLRAFYSSMIIFHLICQFSQMTDKLSEKGYYFRCN